ncbi:hypothetical protein Tco_0994017 [Tanacetum coccineum]
MSDLKFADTHNLVAFLEKSTESVGFEEIVDFPNANPIKYALTVNHTVYCSCIKQFWDTVKAKTINGEVQLQALVDKKKREGKGFSGRVTPLFQTMMVQAHEEIEHIADEVANEEHVPTQSNNPPLSRVNTLGSGENRLSLKELMDLYTKLSDRVLDLETTKKDEKIIMIVDLQQFFLEDEGLGAQEDASKQGRKISDIDADAVVTLIDKTQERNDDNLMFDIGVLDEQEVEVEKVVSIAEVTTESATTTTVDELNLAQTLIEIKAAKPKVRGVMI